MSSSNTVFSLAAVMASKDRLEQVGGHAKRLLATLFAGTSDHGVRLVVPRRIQLDAFSCGLCSARMVADYHGRTISPAFAADFTSDNPDGTCTTPLVRLLRASGLVVRAYYANHANVAVLIDALKQGLPVIVSLPGHYLVVTGFDSEFFYFNDPTPLARLPGKMSRPRFRQAWTREAIIVLGPRSARKQRCGILAHTLK